MLSEWGFDGVCNMAFPMRRDESVALGILTETWEQALLPRHQHPDGSYFSFGLKQVFLLTQCFQRKEMERGQGDSSDSQVLTVQHEVLHSVS